MRAAKCECVSREHEAIVNLDSISVLSKSPVIPGAFSARRHAHIASRWRAKQGFPEMRAAARDPNDIQTLKEVVIGCGAPQGYRSFPFLPFPPYPTCPISLIDDSQVCNAELPSA